MDYKISTPISYIVDNTIKKNMRFQIALAVLPAIVGSCSGHAAYDYEHHCEQALKYADELIKQMKNK